MINATHSRLPRLKSRRFLPLKGDSIPESATEAAIVGDFIERSCGAGERVLVKTRLPLMTVIVGGIWCLFFMGIGWTLDMLGVRFIAYMTAIIQSMGFSGTGDPQYAAFMFLWYVRLVFAGVGIMLFSVYIGAWMATRVALTTHRIIVQRGLIMVRLTEMSIEEIKGEEIDHGFLGRFFDYGRLLIDARFVSDMKLPFIQSPYLVLRMLKEAQAKDNIKCAPAVM